MSSFIDKAKDAAAKAGEVASNNTDKVDAGIEKAGELVDTATGGRFTDQLDAGVTKAQDAVDRLEQQPDGPTPPSDPGR